MEIQHPVLLAVGLLASVGVLILLARRRPGMGLARRLPIAGALVAVVAAQAGVTRTSTVEGAHRVYVLDVSRSFQRYQSAAAERIRGDAARLGPEDLVSVVTFAGRARIAVPPQPADRPMPLDRLEWPGDVDASDIAAGIREALALAGGFGATDIVLVTDGRDTAGAALGGARLARGASVPVSALLVAPADLPDLRIERLAVPPEVRPSEPFSIEVVVSSTVGVTATLALDGPALLLERALAIPAGESRTIRVEHRLAESGFHSIEARVSGLVAEPSRENNRRRARLRVTGAIEIASISSSPATARALSRIDGTHVERLPARSGGDLSRADLIVIDDIGPSDLGERRMHEIDVAVRRGGAGLLLLDGRRVIGADGFRGTPVGDLLPLEPRPEEGRSRPLSLVLILDASGSMAEELDGATKFDRAVRTIFPIPSLRAGDRLGVVIFREAAETPRPLGEVASQGELRESLLGLRPGGGTRLLPALERAMEMLGSGGERARHAILLSDGRSEDPPDAWERWADLAASQPEVTTTVIGIGADIDEALLRRVASTGGGRFHRRDGVDEALAGLYRDEVEAAQGSAFREGSFDVASTGEGPSRGLSDLPPLLGMISAAPRPGADVFLRSDAYPVLAGWRVGLGRALVFTSTLDTDWGREWRGWEGLGGFLGQSIRWAARSTGLDGLDVRTVRRGIETRIEVTRREAPAGSAAPANLVLLLPDEAEIDFRRVGRDRYEVRLGGALPRGTVSLAERSPDGLRPLGVLPLEAAVDLEMRDPAPDVALLEEMARLTGGAVGARLEPPAVSGRLARVSFTPALIVAALVCFLLDLLLSVRPLTAATRRPMVPRRPASGPARPGLPRGA